jgi:hypothetical protein
MKSLPILVVAAASLLAMAAPASAYRDHGHRYRPLRVAYPRALRSPYRAEYRPEVLGRTPFGDTIISGRMGFHRAFLATDPSGAFRFDTMVPGSEESDLGFAFLGSRY